MLAGRRLLETLIVYCKINVHQSIKEIKGDKVTPFPSLPVPPKRDG